MIKDKFRGLNINTKDWVYGDLIHKDDKVYVGYWVKDNDSPSGDGYIECEVIPETVGQYIGRKDDNGKEIYESDIIQFEWLEDSCWGKAGTYKGYIQFHEGVFEVVYIGREEKTVNKDGSWHENSKADDVQSLMGWSENIEVISNIFKSPEIKTGGLKMCEIYKNLFCLQNCGCCGRCKNRDICENVCGIYKENKNKFKDVKHEK